MKTPADFGFKLSLVARLWRRSLDLALSSSDLTSARWRPLVHLSRLGDGARQNELARSLDVAGPTLARLLDRLELAGLVTRREDPLDRRSKRLALTDLGRAQATEAEELAERRCAQMLGDVSTADVDACLRVFDKLLSVGGAADLRS